MSVQPKDLITSVYMWRIISELPERGGIEGHIWRDLFPYDETPSNQFMWESVRSEGNLAGFLSLRGVAVPVEKLGSDRFFADVANLGASWVVDPLVIKDAMDEGAVGLLNNPRSYTGQELKRRINEEMVGGVTTCIQMIERQMEYMAIQAISTGTIVWPPLDADGVAISDPMDHWNPEMEYDFDYTMTTEFVQNASALAGFDTDEGAKVAWNAPGADPLRDLRVINRLVRRTKGLNAKGGKVIMTGDTIETLATNPAILAMIYGDDRTQTGTREFVDFDKLQTFIKTKVGWTIQEYTAQPWTYRTWEDGRAVINPVDYLPDGKVIFIPAGVTPGAMMHSLHPTMEKNWQYGLIPWMVEDPPPVQSTRGGVRNVAWPAFPNSENIFILNAFQ